MNGSFAYGYWQAACTKLEILESMGAWDVIDCEDDINVIRFTWSFKVNQYPDGLIKKFKAIFCARGYM